MSTPARIPSAAPIRTESNAEGNASLEPAAKKPRIDERVTSSSSSVETRTNPTTPEATVSNSEANTKLPANVPSGEHNNVLVEFLFSSYKTQVFPRPGMFSGKFHVEMHQDPNTGRYTIPIRNNNNNTPVQFYLDDTFKSTEAWCMGDETCKEFSGFFSSSMDRGVSFDSGLTLDYFTGNHRNFRVTVRPHHFTRYAPNLKDIKQDGSTNFIGRNIDTWETQQGGFLEFIASVATTWTNAVRWGYYGGTFDELREAEGRYKIKLYTVLSAHRPNQLSLPEFIIGQSPDWDALVQVVHARFPDHSKSWAVRAVRQYRYFVELKINGTKNISPSYAIDEVWHAHLSFPEQYQRDMIALTKGNGILEHKPVHLKQSAKYYEKAHKLHSKRMAKLNASVDKEFWPDPVPYDPSQHEQSSDDEKMMGQLTQGKPTSHGGDASGCAGCG